jgi:hypothetical protein
MKSSLIMEVRDGERGKFIMLSEIRDWYNNTYTILGLERRDFNRIRELMDRIEQSEPAKSLYQIGDVVTWIGQEDVRFHERVNRITEPQPGNFVLWTGDDDFPIGEREVEPWKEEDDEIHG